MRAHPRTIAMTAVLLVLPAACGPQVQAASCHPADIYTWDGSPPVHTLVVDRSATDSRTIAVTIVGDAANLQNARDLVTMLRGESCGSPRHD